MARGLGTGLDAIFAQREPDGEEAGKAIPIQDLRPHPYQPRRSCDPTSSDEWRASMEEHGMWQPPTARKSIKGYEIVVGERRYRAAKEAGLKKVPVVVRDLTEQQMMEMAVLENLQREDLTPIEEASAYQLLMERLNLTQEELAKRLGKSR